MNYITKHDSKFEWESDNSEQGRVDFLIVRHTIGVYNFLETPGELVKFEVSRSHQGLKLALYQLDLWGINLSVLPDFLKFVK